MCDFGGYGRVPVALPISVSADLSFKGTLTFFILYFIPLDLKSHDGRRRNVCGKIRIYNYEID